jgi:hypothetical protein
MHLPDIHTNPHPDKFHQPVQQPTTYEKPPQQAINTENLIHNTTKVIANADPDKTASSSTDLLV